ncbi:MAG TPA: four-helix bundle copper-binding protein [Anaerolineaceae bacterium]|jgi:hypothetical protein
MAPDPHTHRSHPITEQMLRCIQQCTSCHAVCLHSMTVALYSRDLSRDDSLLRALQDCAEISQTSADFMLRGSPLHGLTCEACARICESCADLCEQYPENDNLNACAETCRSCADSCQTMTDLAPDWRDQLSGI